MQEAAVAMLGLGDEYYAQLKADYTRKRNFLVSVLRQTGFEVIEPEGTYYIITRFGKLGKPGEDDMQFAARLVKDHGVACVPCSAFYADKEGHRDMVRFAFCKKDETLEEAARRLRTLT
jgi:aminotransferase